MSDVTCPMKIVEDEKKTDQQQMAFGAQHPMPFSLLSISPLIMESRVAYRYSKTFPN